MLTKAATGAAITVCLALLVQVRHWEKSALAMKAQKRQSKDEATIAELRGHLSTLEEQLHSTNAQNHTLTEEYKARSLSTQVSINTLSEDLSSAKEEVAQHNATIAGLEEARAEDETTIANLRQQLSTVEAQLLSQKSVDTLSEDLSSAREEVAQHNATITDLKKMQAQDETVIDNLMQQLSTLRARLLSANEEVARHDATITDLKEAQAEYVTTIDELREHSLTLEAEHTSISARNSTLMDENEAYRAGFLSMQEYIQILYQDLSNTRERAAQHEAKITDLEARNKMLESTVNFTEKRIVGINKAFDTLKQENASRLTALQQELEQKTKAAAYWKDLCTRSDPDTAQSQQARRRRGESKSDSSESELSPTRTTPPKNQEIAQLGAAYRCR
ncbi:hypothetical protein H1R20_g15873, partial [Candolleomyces eurysporus]